MILQAKTAGNTERNVEKEGKEETRKMRKMMEEVRKMMEMRKMRKMIEEVRKMIKRVEENDEGNEEIREMILYKNS